MTSRIIIVVRDPERKTFYNQALKQFDVSFYEANSLKDAINLAGKEAFNGILFDMPLMVRTTPAIKTALNDLLSTLPCASLNYNPAKNELRLFPRGDHSAECTSIEQFVDICRAFRPRVFSSKKRVPLHYNVLLYLSPGFENPERTATINVSIGGCFIFTARDDISVGSTVWFNIAGLDIPEPVEAVVRWSSPWGAAKKMPGIGVEFKHIPESLREEIEKAVSDT